MKALVWPVVMYCCESWTLRKNEETRLEAFEMKGLRKILRVSWTAKKTRMWANAQPDGRPAEHRWRPLFNATKFASRPLLDAVQ